MRALLLYVHRKVLVVGDAALDGAATGPAPQPEAGPKWTDHVIIVGHGPAGAELATVLREVDMPYVIVELNARSAERRCGRPVAALGQAERQLIAIARALSHEPELLILDEPTSSLSEAEAARLFDIVEDLKARGVAILYISHRMSDIRRLADRIAVLRDGRLQGSFGKPLNLEAAVTAMLGLALAMPGQESAPCSGRLPVFDGKARYDLRLENQGADWVRTRAWRGEAVLCHAYLEPISGYDPGDRPSEEETANPVRIWLAPIGDIYVPIRFRAATQIGDISISARRVAINGAAPD